MTFKERLKASIEHEDARRENVEYWREILEGAREDEHLSWQAFSQLVPEFNKARDRWAEDWRKRRELEEKVRGMEAQDDN